MTKANLPGISKCITDYTTPDKKQEVYDFIEFLLTKFVVSKSINKPAFGAAKGKIFIPADFAAPL